MEFASSSNEAVWRFAKHVKMSAYEYAAFESNDGKYDASESLQLQKAYPERTSDTSFLNIQNELVSIENQVADRREMYSCKYVTSTK